MAEAGRNQEVGAGKTEAGGKPQPSGPRADNPATAGSGETKVKSGAGEQGEGKLKPSATGETGTTPGTNWEQERG